MIMEMIPNMAVINLLCLCSLPWHPFLRIKTIVNSIASEVIKAHNMFAA